MTKTGRPLWVTYLGVFIWILLLANVIYDYIRIHQITLYSILMFFALLIGSTLVPMFLKRMR